MAMLEGIPVAGGDPAERRTMGALAQGRHSDRAFAARALLLCQCIEPGHRMFPSGDQTNQVPPTISRQEAVNVLLQAVRKAK